MARPGALVRPGSPPAAALARAASFPVQQRIIGPGAPLRSVGSFQVRHNIEGPSLSTRGGPLYSSLPLASGQPQLGPSALRTNNWGGVRGLFFEPDFRLQDEDQWQYVGRGRGGYTQVPEYRFAGLGQGDFIKGGGTVYSWRLRTRCLLLLGLLLLALVGSFFWLLFDPNDPLHVGVPMEHRKVHPRLHPRADAPLQRGHNTSHDSLGTGCRTICEYHGVSAPCNARVEWVANHTFSSEPRQAACSKAYDVVLVQCPVCEERASGCRQEAMGCAAGVGQPRPVVGDGCKKRCELAGVDGTCSSQASRLAGSRFAVQRHGCALGLGLVLYGCPACEMCTLAASGCEDDELRAGADASDVDADVDEDAEDEAAEAQPGLHGAVGHHMQRAKDSVGHVAGKAAEATSHWHDAASPHLENAKDSIGDAVGHVGGLLGGIPGALGWQGGGLTSEDGGGMTIGQRRRRRSAASGAGEDEDKAKGEDEAEEEDEEDLFDCSANFHDGSWRHNWSAGQKVWCCDAYGRGCDGEDGTIDCGAGEPKGWTSQKRTWCCEKESKGCPSKG